MDSMNNSRIDLFQSLKDEMSDNYGSQSTSSNMKLNLPTIKLEDDDDDQTGTDEHEDGNSANPDGSSNIFDKAFKKKLDKQNRKELEEEEREKML